MSSSWHSRLSLSIFGQSHSTAIGMTLEGLPPGTPINREALQQFLNRRAPGKHPWETPRKESDVLEFLSGLVDGRTTGAPLTAIIPNLNTRSKDYEALRHTPRPGHADYTAQMKYGGHQDIAGGGHFSGRLTAPLCIAGGICLGLLRERGIQIGAHIVRIGEITEDPFDPVTISGTQLEALGTMDFPVLNPEKGEEMKQLIAKVHGEQDSVGGAIECAVVGLPAGLGDPMFDGMENRIARLAFGVPAVKGIDFGAGFAVAAMRGSENNDPFVYGQGGVKTWTNHHGGILGGITSGMPLLFRVAMKPTPSIAREQKSVHLQEKREESLSIKGRHDPCIVPRAVPCMEAVAALAVYDALLEQQAYISLESGKTR